MVFHTFGDSKKKAVLLLHGMLTPWTIWEEMIAYFSKDSYVIVPELDAHTLEEESRFESVEKEAEILREYLLENTGGKLFLLCGLSLGGRISAVLAGLPDIHVENMVLDGAPLLQVPGFMISFMKSNYKSIIRRSRIRDEKVLESAKRSFLPEKRLPDYLVIADHISQESVEKIIDSAFNSFHFRKYDDCRILFMHGTKGNESLSEKAAVKMKAVNPEMQIACYKGYAHAQLLCFEPEKWVGEVKTWIKSEKMVP